jgi:catechol-2,3-dioxygenase
MQLKINRLILFVQDLPSVASFYRDVIGLPLKGTEEEPGWLELDAGTCTLALHSGGAPNQARRSPKLVFAASDVEAARKELIQRGARLGPVRAFGQIQLCDGKDPEGNLFQISNRS